MKLIDNIGPITGTRRKKLDDHVEDLMKIVWFEGSHQNYQLKLWSPVNKALANVEDSGNATNKAVWRGMLWPGRF
jgi:hypothetical protein